MENFIRQLAKEHFEANRQAFINFIRKSFQLNGDEITDIYNDVWIDVIENIRRGRTEQVKKWKSYVFSLGWKRAYKFVTRRAEMLRVDDEPVSEWEFNEACKKILNDDLSHMKHLERIEGLMTELEAIPKKQRMVIVLYYLKGKSAAEVAETLGYSGARSVITLKKRIICILQERMQAAA